MGFLNHDAEQLVLARLADDTQLAYETLYVALKAPVMKLCNRLMAGSSEAEDVFHDTFATVCRQLPNFRGASSLSTWVLRIALRIAQVSRQRRTRFAPLELVRDYPSNRGSPHDTAEARQRWQRTVAAISELPEPQRAVLALIAVDGLTHQEVALILGVPVGTVWSRLHAARKRLAVPPR